MAVRKWRGRIIVTESYKTFRPRLPRPVPTGQELKSLLELVWRRAKVAHPIHFAVWRFSVHGETYSIRGVKPRFSRKRT